MPSYGVTDTGFVVKPLSVIKADIEAGMQGIFGTNINTDPESPDGQQIGLLIGPIAELWETLAELATVLDPQAAGGILQSKQVRLNGITRVAETKTTVARVELGGVTSTLVPAGTKAETSDTGDVFILQEDVTLSGGLVESSWVAENPGPILCVPNSLSVITTPVAGWNNLDNDLEAAVVGSFEETDGDLRRRRETSTELGAVAQYTALDQAIRTVNTVTDSLLIENNTDGVSALGLPAHSFLAVVEGTGNAKTAQAIWDNRPMGIEDYGSVTGNATDVNGNVQPMNFVRPVEIDIFVTITLTKDTDYPGSGDDDMKQAVVDFAAGTLTDAQGDIIFSGFNIGDDVLYSRIYQALHTVPGHTVDSLDIDTSALPATGTVNIAITNLQKSRWTLTNIGIA